MRLTHTAPFQTQSLPKLTFGKTSTANPFTAEGKWKLQFVEDTYTIRHFLSMTMIVQTFFKINQLQAPLQQQCQWNEAVCENSQALVISNSVSNKNFRQSNTSLFLIFESFVSIPLSFIILNKPIKTSFIKITAVVKNVWFSVLFLNFLQPYLLFHEIKLIDLNIFTPLNYFLLLHWRREFFVLSAENWSMTITTQKFQFP